MADLMSMSYNGSLPSTSDGRKHQNPHGSAPDLTSHPVTNVWTNPLNDTFANSRGYRRPTLAEFTVSFCQNALFGGTNKLYN